MSFRQENYAKNKKRTVLSVLWGCMKIFADRSMTKKRAAKGRPYKFFQNHYRSYSVMRFLSFIFIHIFIGDVHYIVKPEVFHRGYCCTDAYWEDIGSTASPVQLCHFILYLLSVSVGAAVAPVENFWFDDVMHIADKYIDRKSVV